MSEKSGLLQDMLSMIEQGRPLDPNRVGSINESLRRQIDRSDGIVKKLNRFSHSVDSSRRSIEIPQMLDFMLSLVERTASMRKIQIARGNDQGVARTVITDPFVFQNMLWKCFEYAMDRADETRELMISACFNEDDIEIAISGLSGNSKHSALPDTDKEDRMLLDHLNGKLRYDDNILRFTLLTA